MHGNPWKVESVQAFSCLKCPECTFFTKKENNFENHALRNHPLSKVLFDKLIYPSGSFQDYVVKKEIPNDMNHVRIKEEPTELSDFQKDPLNFCETTIHQGKEIWTDPDLNDQAEGEIIYPHGQPCVQPINMEIMNMPKKKKRKRTHLVPNEYNEINPIEGFIGFDLHPTQVPINVSYPHIFYILIHTDFYSK